MGAWQLANRWGSRPRVLFAIAAVALLAGIVVAILIPSEPIGHLDGPAGPPLVTYDGQVELRVASVVAGVALAGLLALVAWRGYVRERNKSTEDGTGASGSPAT